MFQHQTPSDNGPRPGRGPCGTWPGCRRNGPRGPASSPAYRRIGDFPGRVRTARASSWMAGSHSLSPPWHLPQFVEDAAFVWETSWPLRGKSPPHGHGLSGRRTARPAIRRPANSADRCLELADRPSRLVRWLGLAPNRRDRGHWLRPRPNRQRPRKSRRAASAEAGRLPFARRRPAATCTTSVAVWSATVGERAVAPRGAGWGPGQSRGSVVPLGQRHGGPQSHVVGTASGSHQQTQPEAQVLRQSIVHPLPGVRGQGSGVSGDGVSELLNTVPDP